MKHPVYNMIKVIKSQLIK